MDENNLKKELMQRNRQLADLKASVEMKNREIKKLEDSNKVNMHLFVLSFKCHLPLYWTGNLSGKLITSYTIWQFIIDLH